MNSGSLSHRHRQEADAQQSADVLAGVLAAASDVLDSKPTPQQPLMEAGLDSLGVRAQGLQIFWKDVNIAFRICRSWLQPYSPVAVVILHLVWVHNEPVALGTSCSTGLVEGGKAPAPHPQFSSPVH